MKLFVGEDVLTARCADNVDLSAKAHIFRQSGHWEEVVRGMTDLTAKYDPLTMSGAEAEARFRALWDSPVLVTADEAEPVVLAASFEDAAAPDRQMVAEALGIDVGALAERLEQCSYRVTMMGFQPGFAYLEDMDGHELPDLARLDTPRQNVAAGSIGFLGRRACIYALDGPGGWPIVGRVMQPLFRREDAQPFLLSAGQQIRFRSA